MLDGSPGRGSDADLAGRDNVDRRQSRAAVFDHPLKCLCEPRHIEGFHDKALASCVSRHGFIRSERTCADRNHNDVFRPRVRLQPASRLPPIEVNHGEVHQDDGWQILTREYESLGGVASGKDSKGAAARQIRGQRFSAIVVIINDENGRLLRVQASSIDSRGGRGHTFQTDYCEHERRWAGRIEVLRHTEGRHGQDARGANERQAGLRHDLSTTTPSTSLIRC